MHTAYGVPDELSLRSANGQIKTNSLARRGSKTPIGRNVNGVCCFIYITVSVKRESDYWAEFGAVPVLMVFVGIQSPGNRIARAHHKIFTAVLLNVY